MTRNRWIALAMVLITGLVGAWLLYRYGERYCTALKAANLSRDAKDKIAPLDCAEFWINRYQAAWSALLGAGAAIGAAMTAWAGVQRQVRQQARSNLSAELALWQDRVSQIDRDLQEMQFAQDMFTDAVRVEYEARLAGAQDKFEAKHFAKLLRRGGIAPFDQVRFTGAPRTAREFNRLTQILGRVAEAQLNSNPVLPEFEAAFWEFHGFQSEIIKAMNQRRDELEAAQEVLQRLAQERERIVSGG